MRKLTVGIVVLFLAAVFVAPSIRGAEPAASTQEEVKAKPPEGEKAQPPDERAEYEKKIAERAAKILDKVGIEDAEKRGRVEKIVMQQYFNLNDWQQAYEEELKALKGQDTDEAKARTAEIEAERQKLHDAYLAALAAELTPEQIVTVKDGMTSGKVKATYDGYMSFVPDMSEDLKKMVMDYLVEAREKAIDGVSSKEKDAIFGKYKGKINNKLSAAGIDLKKGEQEFFAKKKAEAEAAKAAGSGQ